MLDSESTNKRLYHESIFINAYYNQYESGLISNNDFFVICFIDSGQTTVTCEGQNYILSPGDIFIACPYDRVEFCCTDGGKGSYITLQFYSEVLSIGRNVNPALSKLVSHVKNNNRFFSFFEDNDFEIINSILAIFDERKSIFSNSEVNLRANTLKIISWILKQQEKKAANQELKKPKKNQHKIEEIIAYVKNHYTEKLQLSEIAKNNYISYSHLSRQFKLATGFTFNEYINRKRVDRSAVLLVTTDDSIAKIAMSLGYGDKSYYTLQFTNYYKMSPSEFRRRFKTKTPLYELYGEN